MIFCILPIKTYTLKAKSSKEKYLQKLHMNVGEVKMFNKLLCDSWHECKARLELPWE